ncbi:hypothetical protein M426DRAFT_322046 [Hypoxylon sp. CI-4A]|nr:hypothetical protein M426DRAFT_322046 [Hypoxylon sp. CI-4A]
MADDSTMGTVDIRGFLQHGVIPAAPYSRRAPSPPTILIPHPHLADSTKHLAVVPTYDKVDPTSLSPVDLKIITQNYKEQLAMDSAHNWVYESRRTAQPILDFIYLGPSSVARDRQWLRDNGITMLLAARDSSMANIRLMDVDQVAQELGIEAAHVDVAGYSELIRAFPSVVGLINNHMLGIYRKQAVNVSDISMEIEEGKMVIPQKEFQRGKVLVFCETGNDRSASVVVAYLMSVFGVSMVEAIQFVHFKRFCINLNDELKSILHSYEGLLSAQRIVHRYELESFSTQSGESSTRPRRVKRGLEDLGFEDDMTGTDHDRFQGREAFAPFIDDSVSE